MKRFVFHGGYVCQFMLGHLEFHKLLSELRPFLTIRYCPVKRTLRINGLEVKDFVIPPQEKEICQVDVEV